MAQPSQVAAGLGSGGRLVIPARWRKALGWRPGAKLVLSLRGDEIRICSLDQVRRRVQERVCRLIPAHVSLVDELIRDRRREAELE